MFKERKSHTKKWQQVLSCIHKLSGRHTPYSSKCTANEQDKMDWKELDNEEHVTTHELLEEAMRSQAIESTVKGYSQDNITGRKGCLY